MLWLSKGKSHPLEICRGKRPHPRGRLVFEEEPVLRVVRAYGTVGRSLQRREPIPFSLNVAREAESITRVITDNVTAVRFETADSDFVVYGQNGSEKVRSLGPRVSFGTVSGRVQALTSRGKLKFTLYDSVFDKPVACYYQDGHEDEMKDIWGKRVLVTGRVTREPDQGRATAIRNITQIAPVPDIFPGGYKIARGGRIIPLPLIKHIPRD
jgi:hypothetical protein